MDERAKKIKDVIDKIKNKDFNIYYFTMDSRGVPLASIANIYEHVKVLTDLGYKAHILHESNDYKLNGDDEGMGLVDWLGDEYGSLSHVFINGNELNIHPEDFIVIPEVFSNLMAQVKNFPCKKIVLSQSYSNIFEFIKPGISWYNYGFEDIITTCESQKEYLSKLFHTSKIHVASVGIPEYFKPSDKPKKPIISIVTREQGLSHKIAKQFYLQYPMYRWITFRELANISRKRFAKELGESCLAVWVDEKASFGTFPLEAMECETPIIGVVPDIIPDWLKDEDGKIKNNGVWTNTSVDLPDLIVNYMKLWLEDSVPDDLINGLKESKGKYTMERSHKEIKNVWDTLISDRVDFLGNELNKITESINI